MDFKEIEIVIIAKKGLGFIGFWELNKEMIKVLKQVL